MNLKQIIKDIRAAEKEVNTSPTDGQIAAGNYKKGHVTINGFAITIENPKGSTRSGIDPDGKEWSSTMNHTYGYFDSTLGKDGDEIDVFIGDNPVSEKIFVIDQVDPKSRKFDESKVMFGFDSAGEAKKAYMSNYDRGWKGFGEITEVEIEEFRDWLYDGYRQGKPFSSYSF